MSGDDLEGPEVDLLIQELSTSARMRMAAKAAVKPPVVSAPPAPPVARTSDFGGTNRLIVPDRARKSLLSSFKFSSFRMPALPSIGTITLPRIPMLQIAMPRIGLPHSAMSRLTMPRVDLPQIGVPRRVTVVRMCVGLGVLLASAMPFWPYPKSGVLWLLWYLFAVGMVLVAGIWSARLTWETRLGTAHTVALGVVLWGITLAAEETLPLIDCSTTPWLCP